MSQDRPGARASGPPPTCRASALYGPGEPPRRRGGRRARAPTRSPGACTPRGYRGRLWTMRQYAGFGTAAESNRRYRYLLEQGTTGPLRGLRPAHPDRLRLRRPPRPRRGGQGGGGDRQPRGHGDASSTAIPLDRVSTSMTINATAAILLALYVAAGAPAGHPGGGALGHRAERHPQGVRRARDLDLPARPVAAPRHRPLRLLRGARAEVEHDLDLRLPHPRGGGHGAPGARLHLRERRSSTCARRRRRGSIPTASASGSRSSSPATPTSSRRWRSSAARGGSGRGS